MHMHHLKITITFDYTYREKNRNLKQYVDQLVLKWIYNIYIGELICFCATMMHGLVKV